MTASLQIIVGMRKVSVENRRKNQNTIFIRVKKNRLDAQLIHSIFVNLYMFRAYLSPSSGGTTVCIQHLVLIGLFRRLSFFLVGFVQPEQQTVI